MTKSSPSLALDQLAKTIDLPSLKFYKLDQMREVVKSLGHPERCAPVILVAGTNGKGSVVSILSEMLMKSGYRVGSYFSPHVLHRGERIRINMKECSEAGLVELETEFEKQLSELTYFERMTALSFLMFRKEKVDVQVLEVGMGGRLDATNVSEPEVAVITHIGKDHTEVLGTELEQIAREKAGILRPGIPFVLGPNNNKVHSLLESECQQRGAQFIDSTKVSKRLDLQDQLRWLSKEWGAHQAANFCSAVAAYEAWTQRTLSPDLLSGLLKSHPLKGRSQVLRKDPLLILDGAHNPTAAQSFADWLSIRFPGKKFRLVFGCMQGKDVEGILRPMEPILDRVDVVSFFPEREWEPSLLKAKILELFPRSFAVQDHSMGLEKLVEEVLETGDNSLVMGSFYLVGDFLSAIERIKK